MNMKHLYLLAATSLIFASEIQADEALSRAQGCFACHTIENKLIGPTYKAIAKKYSGQKDGETKIAQAIIKGTPFPGGVGWQKEGQSAMPYMPPKATVKPDEAAKMAKWIIGLK
jgi:cytochrome c